MVDCSKLAQQPFESTHITKVPVDDTGEASCPQGDKDLSPTAAELMVGPFEQSASFETQL